MSGESELVEALREIGADVEEHSTWYRALCYGVLWCESTNPNEVRESIAGREGCTLQQLKRYLITMPWESWNPS